MELRRPAPLWPGPEKAAAGMTPEKGISMGWVPGACEKATHFTKPSPSFGRASKTGTQELLQAFSMTHIAAKGYLQGRGCEKLILFQPYSESVQPW